MICQETLPQILRGWCTIFGVPLLVLFICCFLSCCASPGGPVVIPEGYLSAGEACLDAQMACFQRHQDLGCPLVGQCRDCPWVQPVSAEESMTCSEAWGQMNTCTGLALGPDACGWGVL